MFHVSYPASNISNPNSKKVVNPTNISIQLTNYRKLRKNFGLCYTFVITKTEQ